MKNALLLLFCLALTVALFCSAPTAAHAQVDYDSVIEKIHYRYTDRGTVNQNGEQVPFVTPLTTGAQEPHLRIYMFADLAEQFSQRFFHDTFPQLLKNHQEDIQFIYVHHPFLEQESNVQMGIVAQCVGEQGQFWVNLDGLIAHANALEKPTFLQNVDQDKLQACMSQPIIKTTVLEEGKDAAQDGMSGVPSFVIQDVSKPDGYATKVIGGQSLEIFERAIQDESGVDTNKAKIDQLESQVAAQSKQLAEAQHKTTLLERALATLRGFVDGILQAVGWK